MKFIIQSLALTMLCLGLFAEERPPTEDYLPFVKVIHPYENFSAVGFEDPEGVFTRENYNLYLTVHARYYRKTFTLEEMKEIAKFFSSDIGERLLVFYRNEDPFSEFLDQMRKADQTEVSEEKPKGAWTCPLHPDIRSPEAGTCPVCGMELTRPNDTER